jgi:uncharacterized SAM-binding protein YcdF (DUF218 family)
MFFYVSKILWFFAAPTNLLVMAVLVGFLLRRRALGRFLLGASALGFALLAISPLPKIVLRALEDRFPIVEEANEGRIDGIVVLGGAVGINRGLVTFNDAASRMTTAIALARRHPGARMVFTGGDAGFLKRDRETEAEAAGRLFRMTGLDMSRIALEDRSRNTRENAIYTKPLVEIRPGERWVLVTSAFHMPRSIACFRAVGLDLDAYPVDFRTQGGRTDYWRPFSRFSDALRMIDLAAREWIGIFAYRAAGYTGEMLPAPRPSR